MRIRTIQNSARAPPLALLELWPIDEVHESTFPSLGIVRHMWCRSPDLWKNQTLPLVVSSDVCWL